MTTYKILRFSSDFSTHEIIATGLTLTEAQERGFSFARGEVLVMEYPVAKRFTDWFSREESEDGSNVKEGEA